MDRSYNHFKGRIAEKAFEKEYQRYGWATIKITIPIEECLTQGRIRMMLNEEGIRNGIFNVFTVPNKREITINFINDLKEIKSANCLLPDYLLLQPPNKIIIYEIKNNSRKTNLISHKAQKEGIKKLKEKGYKVYLKNKYIPINTTSNYYQEIIAEVNEEQEKNRKSLIIAKEKMLNKQEQLGTEKIEEVMTKKSWFKIILEKFGYRVNKR